MAAGRGIRMSPLTDVIPKPMAPYQGSTLIADNINKLKPFIQNIHITVGYKGAILAEHVIGCGINSLFDTSSKGNAWWIYNTLMKHINEPMLVLTCDNVVELEFEKLIHDYYRFDAPACMVVPVKPVERLEGDYIFHDEHIVKKLDRHETSDIYCSGIQILNPYKINLITDNTEDFYSVWSQLIYKNELYCASILPKKWFTVDTIEHLDMLNNLSSMNKGENNGL